MHPLPAHSPHLHIAPTCTLPPPAHCSHLRGRWGTCAPAPLTLVLLSRSRSSHAHARSSSQIDELERRDRKSRAERSWEASTLEALELPPDAGGSSDDDGGRRRGGGANAAAGGAGSSSTAGLTKKEVARLGGLKHSLGEMLAAPLQASVSARFFTGGSGALATAAGAKAAAACQGEEGPAGASVVPAEAVTQTVALASRLAAATAAAKQASAAKANRRKGGGVQKKVGAAGAKGKSKALSKADMSKLIMSNNQKRRERKMGLVVVGGGAAFGRDVQAPSALQALRGSR